MGCLGIRSGSLAATSMLYRCSNRRLTPIETKRLLIAVDAYSNPMFSWIVRIALMGCGSRYEAKPNSPSNGMPHGGKLADECTFVQASSLT